MLGVCFHIKARGQIQNSSLFLFSKREKCPLAEGLAVWVGFLDSRVISIPMRNFRISETVD